MQENAPEGKQSRSRTWLHAWLLIGVIAALLFVIPRSFGAALEREDGFIPAPLHAGALADYSAEGLIFWRYSADRSLIESAIRDRDPNATDASDRAAHIVQSFETPVPTVTSQSLWSMATAAATAQATTQSSPMSTPSESVIIDLSATAEITATSGPSPMPTETSGSGPGATSTTTAYFPPAPMNTPTAFPTAAPATTDAPSGPASATPFPSTVPPTTAPTNTPTQVPPTPLPTNTPAPPPTSSADLCKGVAVMNFSVNGQKVNWLIVNNSVVSVEITVLRLDWPVGNDELKKLELAGDVIWDKGDDFPPTNIGSGWENGVSRTIGVGVAKALSFQFEKAAASSGYALRINFDNGCVLFQNH